MTPDEDFAINNSLDILYARRTGMELALKMGFSKAEAVKIAVVISELGRNIVLHAGGGGSIRLYIEETERRSLRIIAVDEGPGIADVEAALLINGMGLAGSKRIMDEFEIASGEQGGTQITAVKWLD